MEVWQAWELASAEDSRRACALRANKYVELKDKACRRCGTPWMLVKAQVQERAADEAAAVYLECANGHINKHG
jgi:hypothetical protein